MSKDDEGKGGDYEAGYRKPPKEHQFKKGTSGNPGGAPSKRRREPIDVAGILNEPLVVKSKGARRKMPPFEVSLRQLVQRGLKKKDLKAILEVLDLCVSFGLLVPPKGSHGGGVIRAPKGVDFHEWVSATFKPRPSPTDEEGPLN